MHWLYRPLTRLIFDMLSDKTYTVSKKLKCHTAKENVAPPIRFDEAFVSEERAVNGTIP